MTPSRHWDVRKKSSGDKVTTLQWDNVSKNLRDDGPMYSADSGGADFIRDKKKGELYKKVIGKVKERKTDARNARKGAKVELVWQVQRHHGGFVGRKTAD